MTIFVVDASAAAHEPLPGGGLPVSRRHVVAHAVERTCASLLARLEGGNDGLALVTFDVEVKAVTEPTRHLDAARVLRQIGAAGDAAEGRTLAAGLNMAGRLASWFVDHHGDGLPASVCILVLLAGACNHPDATARAYEDLVTGSRVGVACAAVGESAIPVPFPSGRSHRAPARMDADGLAAVMLRMARAGEPPRREGITLG